MTQDVEILAYPALINQRSRQYTVLTALVFNQSIKNRSLTKLRFSVSDFVLEVLDALGADVLSLVAYDTLCAVAEDACGMILVENDVVTLNKDFQRITLGNIKSTAQLDGKDNASELVNFSYNSGRFHTISRFRFK